MREPLPPELADTWGHLPDIEWRTTGEWSSACPRCYGANSSRRDKSDRFRMWSSSEKGPARAWCRQCDFKWMVGRNNDEWTGTAQVDYLEVVEREFKRVRQKLRWLAKQTFWKEWHEQMTDYGRKLWHEAGIHDALINAHMLGYSDSAYSDCGGVLSIPYLRQDVIRGLQYRLIDPPTEGDRYRFLKGTRANWFFAWPHYDDLKQVVLVTEGVKKGLVLWQTIATLDSFCYQGEEITIIATPSKAVPNRMLDELKDAKRVIWMLDPDAWDHDPGQMSCFGRNVTAVGKDKSRFVKLPGKVDDLILEHKINGKVIQQWVNQANMVLPVKRNMKPTTRYI